MRLAAGLLALLCIMGCRGVVVLEQRTDAPPHQPVPVPKSMCCDISQREAAEIAVAEAVSRDCDRLHVHNVRSDGKRWKVELYGQCGCHDARIRVKVDRRTGEVHSYKAKLDDCGDD